MLKRYSVIVAISALAVLGVKDSSACSLARGFDLFELSSTLEPFSGAQPESPNVESVTMKRGFDDGDGASCSDAAILTIVLSPTEADRDVGYSFRMTSGVIVEELFDYDGFYSPRLLSGDTRGFYFVWLDRGGDINGTFEIRAVSKTGIESEPVELRVTSH